MHIHQTRELLQIIALERRFALVPEVLHEMQVLHHRLVRFFTLVILLLQDRRGRTGVTGKEEQEIVLEIVQSLFRNLQRPCLDLSIGQMNLKQVMPP